MHKCQEALPWVEAKPSLQGSPGFQRVWEAGCRPRRCRGPAHTVACQCPLEQETAADAEGILRMLSEVQLHVPLGERALRLPLPGIRGLSAFLLLAQGLRLGGWGLETQGQGSPGPGYAGCWPEQILTHHWWG